MQWWEWTISVASVIGGIVFLGGLGIAWRKSRIEHEPKGN